MRVLVLFAALTTSFAFVSATPTTSTSTTYEGITNSQWITFMKTHDKDYKNDAKEELRRMQNFIRNKERVEELKKLDPTADYSVELSPFADESPEEFK